MPELPEVETTKKSLEPLLGQDVQDVQVLQPKLRWSMPDDLDQLKSHTLTHVARRAKYLILTFAPSKTTANDAKSGEHKLLIHLGMSGSLQQHSYGSETRKHDHLILIFKNAHDVLTQLHYHDPRRFGSVLWYKDYGAKLLNHLGVEPLSAAFNADYLYQLIQRTSGEATNKRPITRAIKSVIMEQQVVVGVGNIYATESLYLAKIHPATPACELTQAQIKTLVDHIKVILEKAIALGGSTLRDFTVASGQTGYFQQTLNVYGRQGENCLDCQSTLDNIKLNGRASVYCPTCQPVSSSSK